MLNIIAEGSEKPFRPGLTLLALCPVVAFIAAATYTPPPAKAQGLFNGGLFNNQQYRPPSARNRKPVRRTYRRSKPRPNRR